MADEEILAAILHQCPHGITTEFCPNCSAAAARAEALVRHPSQWAQDQDENEPGPPGPWAVAARTHTCPWCNVVLVSKGDRMYQRDTLEELLFVCAHCADDFDEEDREWEAENGKDPA